MPAHSHLLRPIPTLPAALAPVSAVQGEGGYLRVTRKGNDCGVASEPVYVELRPVGRL